MQVLDGVAPDSSPRAFEGERRRWREIVEILGSYVHMYNDLSKEFCFFSDLSF